MGLSLLLLLPPRLGFQEPLEMQQVCITGISLFGFCVTQQGSNQ